jgi:hypothetical protein
LHQDDAVPIAVRTLNDLSGVYQKWVADTVQRFGGATARR